MELEDQLTEIFCFLAGNSLKYANLSRAHFQDVIFHNSYDTPAVRRINEFMEKLAGEAARKQPGMDREQLVMALMQLLTATMLYCGLFPRLLEGFSGLNIYDSAVRERYVRRAVRRLLTDCPVTEAPDR